MEQLELAAGEMGVGVEGGLSQIVGPWQIVGPHQGRTKTNSHCGKGQSTVWEEISNSGLQKVVIYAPQDSTAQRVALFGRTLGLEFVHNQSWDT